MYKVYTFPACEKCHKAVSLFRERNIPYEEISAGSLDGRNRLKEFMKKYNQQIKRDEKGWLVLPLIVYQNSQEIRIHQGEDGLEDFLK